MPAQNDRTIYTPTAGVNKRQEAHKMSLAGATVGAVIEALGLKQSTVNVYFWEAKRIAKDNAELTK
jgi:hypothetical protein